MRIQPGDKRRAKHHDVFIIRSWDGTVLQDWRGKVLELLGRDERRLHWRTLGDSGFRIVLDADECADLLEEVLQ